MFFSILNPPNMSVKCCRGKFIPLWNNWNKTFILLSEDSVPFQTSQLEYIFINGSYTCNSPTLKRKNRSLILYVGTISNGKAYFNCITPPSINILLYVFMQNILIFHQKAREKVKYASIFGGLFSLF